MAVPAHSVACTLWAAGQSSLGNCWTGTDNTRTCKPVGGLRLSNSELGSRSGPFSLKCLLGHRRFSSLFGISVGVESRHHLPWALTGDGATHEQNFLGQHPLQQTHWGVSPLVVARDSSVHIVQRTVCVTQSSGRQVANIRCLCERLVSPGMGNHQKSRAAWIWSVNVPGVKWPATGVAANFSMACWPVFLDNMTWTSARFSMARAASRSPSQVLFRFTTEMPSFFLLQMCCSISKSRSGPPKWVPAARNLGTLLVHLQGIKDSSHCERFPLSYMGIENNAEWSPLCIA